MPSAPCPVILALLLPLAPGCTPARFGWQPDGGDEVAGYRAAFAAAAGDRVVARVDRDAFGRQLAGARVLWLGDHHQSRRLHELQRELLARLLADGHRLAFALEAIGSQDETWVQLHLDGRLPEPELRRRMLRRWPGSWLDDPGVDAPHWRALLALARRHATPVHALEPTPRLPLAQRDACIVAAVQAAAAAAPDRLLVVVVGQAHLLGAGDVVRRAGLPAVVIGGEPPPALAAQAAASKPPAAAGELWQSSGGPWWFAELLAARAAPDQRGAAAPRAASWPQASSAATR